MRHVLDDVRLSLRALRRDPVYAAATILTLAIGTAANTAVFNLASGLLLSRPHVPAADRLVRVCAERDTGGCDVMSYPNVMDVAERAKALTAVAAHRRVEAALASAGSDAVVELVSGRYFDVVGVAPILGRLLGPEDDVRPGGHPVAVVSHSWWRRHLAVEQAAVGRTVDLAGGRYTIVGVAPADLRGSYDAFPCDFWVPLSMHEQIRPRGTERTRRGWGWLEATARMKAGVTVEQAAAELAVIAEQLRREHPAINDGFRLTAVPASALPESYARGARILLGGLQVAALLVLIVGAANVGAAQMARMVARRRETAVRLSLGASRGTLFRLWAAEGLVLASGASAVGIVIGLWARDTLLAVASSVPGAQLFAPTVSVDLRVVAFAVAVTVIASLAAGALPALRSASEDPALGLREETGTSTSARRARWQAALVVGQVLVSTALLGFSLLLVRAVSLARTFDPGFETGGLVLAEARPLGSAPAVEEAREYFVQARERLLALPGVEAATYAAVVPLGPGQESRGIRLPGQEPRAAVSVDANIVGPSYFTTMGIPLMAGRDIEEADARVSAPAVAVLNQTLARRLFASGSPLGQRLVVGAEEVEVVGVARDIAYDSLGEPPRPHLYLSSGRFFIGSGGPPLVLHVRTRTLSSATVAQALQALDSRVRITAIGFDRLREVPLAPRRLMALSAAATGTIALALAAVGLFALMAYTVGQRTREIGIRMALGARAATVRRMVLGRGMVLAASGLLPGTALAILAARRLAGGLFGMSPADPIALALLWAVVAVVATAACWVPAHRATRIDPVEALRHG